MSDANLGVGGVTMTPHALLRAELLVCYGEQCALTGCRVVEALDLVLIDPRATASPNNTLVLRADVARLFRAGLIACDPLDFSVSVAASLAGTPYAELSGAQLRQPNDSCAAPGRRFLAEHHRHFMLHHGHGLQSEPMLLEYASAAASVSEQSTDVPEVPIRRSEAATGALPSQLNPLRVLHVKSLVNGVACSPDGSLIVTGSWDGVARLWQMADGYLIQTLQSDLGEINTVGFHPEGGIVAAAGRNQRVQLWHVADGQPLRTLCDQDGHQGAVFGLAYTPNGELLASGSWDRTVRLWRMQDGGLERVLAEHRGAVNCVAISPTGKLLASGSHDRQVRLWRMRDGALLEELQGHQDAVFSLAFNPTGELLASAGSDQTIRVWRVADGALLYALAVERGAIFSLAFSPDGKLLASGDYGRAVRLWRATDGAPVAVGSGHSEGVTSLAFSPDGKLLLTGSFDATVRMWELV
ncbi:WD40 repeat domain-containing protein [Candidatus Viridilinea mediisalina]|nr:WD40 repeat domain-containing protein [Candidatus Viridilinea mediisalina]